MGVWLPNYHLNTRHLNTGQVKVHCSDVFVIQIPAILSQHRVTSQPCVLAGTSDPKNSAIYSGDLKYDHSKSGNIRNPDFLKVRFQMVRTVCRPKKWQI